MTACHLKALVLSFPSKTSAIKLSSNKLVRLAWNVAWKCPSLSLQALSVFMGQLSGKFSIWSSVASSQIQRHTLESQPWPWGLATDTAPPNFKSSAVQWAATLRAWSVQTHKSPKCTCIPHRALLVAISSSGPQTNSLLGPAFWVPR